MQNRHKILLSVLAISLAGFAFLPVFAQAATKTIVDAGGNWGSNGTWSPSGVPTAADDVVATATSGNLTINGTTRAARSIDLTNYTGTVTHNAGVTLNIGDGTAGAGNVALLFPAGMTYTLGNATTSAISFVSTSATQQTVDFGGYTSGNTTFNGSGGSWILAGQINTGGGLTMSNGSFDGSSHDINVTGNFTFSSGTFTATSGTMTVAGNFNKTGGTFTHNDGTVVITGVVNTFTPDSATFYDLTFNNDSSDITLAGDFTVAHTFTNDSAGAVNNPASARVITAQGDVVISGGGTFGGANLTVDMTGTSKAFSQSTGTFDSLLSLSGSSTSLSQSGGSLGSSSVVTVAGTTHTATASTAMSFYSLVINSGNTLAMGSNDFTVTTAFTVAGNTLSGTGTWLFNDDLTISSGTLTATSGTMTVVGDFTKTGGTFTHNSGTVIITGTTNTFDPDGATFYDLTLNNDSSDITLASDFTVAHTFTNDSAGAINNPATPIAITAQGNVNQTGGGTFGGANLTVDMTGTSKTFTMSAGSFASLLNFSGSSMGFDQTGGSFTSTSVVTVEAGTGVTPTDNVSLYKLVVDGGLSMGAYDLTVVDDFSIDTTSGYLGGTSCLGGGAVSGDWYFGGDLTITAPLTHLFYATTGTITVVGDFARISGSPNEFSACGGTFIMTGVSNTFDPQGTFFYDLIFNNDSSDITLASGFTVTHTFTNDSAGAINNPATPLTITTQGNVNMTGGGTFGGANLTVDMQRLSGSPTYSQSAGTFNSLLNFINLATYYFTQTGGSFGSSSLITISQYSTLATTTDMNIYSITTDGGGSALLSGDGTAAGFDVTVNGNLINNGQMNFATDFDDLTVSGTFTNGANGIFYAPPGLSTVTGDFAFNGSTSDFHHDNGEFLFNGSLQDIDANGITFYDMTINNDSANTTLSSNFTVTHNFVNDSAGAVDDPLSPVTITANLNVTQSGGGTLGGPNLTVSMPSNTNHFSMSAGTFDSLLTFTGSSFTTTNLTIAQSGGVFGANSVITIDASMVNATTDVAPYDLTITSDGVFRAGGNSLAVAGDYANNSGYLILLGTEPTVSFANGMDVDSGTTEYWGDGGGADTHVLKDFGATDYYNLNIATSFDTIELGANTVVAGNLSIGYDSLVVQPGILDVSTSNYALNVAGNWTSSSNATFTQRSGTVTLDGINQTMTTGTGANTFYNLVKQETINDSTNKTVTITGSITIGNNLTLDGLDANDLLVINGGNTITFSGSSTFSTTGYLAVQNSTVADSSSGITVPLRPANSQDLGNTVNWFGPRISGHVYTDDVNFTPYTTGTVAISINGALASGSSGTDGSGAYSIADNTIVAGDVITLYLDGGADKAVTVTVGTGANQTGLDLYVNDLVARCDNSCSLTNADLDIANDNGDTDIDAIYTGTTTITMADPKTLYIPASHTFAPGNPVVVQGNFKNNGTFTHGSSTLTLAGGSGGQLKTNGSSLYNVVVNAGSGTGTYTLQDALTVVNNLTISSGTLDVNNSGNYAVNIAGNWSNSDAFTARAGTVTLNGVDQTISGTTTFYNLTKQETTNNTTNKTLTFTSGTTTTIGGALTLDGLDANDKLLIRASTTSAATIAFTGSSTFSTTGYLDVEYNTATDSSSGVTLPLNPANSTDSGNTTGWFTSTYSIGGTVYTDEGTTNIGANKTVAISINGAAAAGTDDTDASGVYSITGLTISAGDVLTLYLDGETEKAVTVTLASGTDQTGVDLYQDDLITRCDNSCSLSNTNLNTSNNNGDTDISSIYDVVSDESDDQLNVASGKSLFIPVGHTYAPGAYIHVGGNFTNNGTYTKGTETITLTGTGTQTLKTNGSELYNAKINGSGGTYTLQDALTVANNLTITAGTLDTKSGSNYAISVSGNWSNTGTFTARSGVVTFAGSATKTITSGGSSFYDVVINTSGSRNLADSTTVSHVLTITAGTFTPEANTLTLSGTTGTPFVNNATFTAGSGSVAYTGNNSGGDTTVINVAYNNLIINNASETYVLAGNTTVANDLTITAGTLDVVSGQNYSLSVVHNWFNAGTFTARSGTVTLTTNSSGDTLTSGASSFYNLTINASGGTYTLQDALTVANNLTITSGTLDTKSGSNYAVNVAGNWSNSGTFTARSGTVTLNGVDQTISGSTSFYNLTKQESTNNSTNKTLTFTSGTTTTITHTLTLDGLDANDKLLIRASTTSAATIAFTGSSTFSTTGYLDIEYNTATDSSSGITLPLNPANSTDSGNTTGWFASPAAFDQKYFRFYSDNTVPAGLNNANPLAAQNTNYNVGLGTTFRLRIQTANTGGTAGDIVRRLEFKEDSGSWTQITTNSNNVRLSNSSNFADGAATTARLTSTGTFAAGQGKDTGSDTSSLSLTNAYYTEDEFSLILQPGAAGHGYTFRITNAGTPLDTYTVTPAINTPDNTPPVPSGFNPATTSTIKTATPNITYNLDEKGDCKASTANASYTDMSGADCTGDGSTGGACLMPTLGANGSKTIYFACRDVWGNEDTISTTHSITYTLTASSGQTGSILIEGLGKILGSGLFR